LTGSDRQQRGRPHLAAVSRGGRLFGRLLPNGRGDADVDVDALEVAAGRATQYSALSDPSLDDYRSAIAAVFARFTVAVAAITA
jgi:hypothetical protein